MKILALEGEVPGVSGQFNRAILEAEARKAPELRRTLEGRP
jgi:hypothetical protein